MKNVVYTSLVGKSDTLKNPEYILEGWDYICFSNDLKSADNNNIWQIRPIPFKHKNSRRLSRYVKIKPHEVLSSYEYSLYLDSNIEIIGADIAHRINQLIDQNQLISLIPHPIRNCIYKEAQVCLETGKAYGPPIRKLCKYLKSYNYPENIELFENGLMLRKHNNEKMVKINNSWWELYMNFSERDQLSLGFLMWKDGIHCEPFFSKGISVRNVSSIRFYQHNTPILKKIEVRLKRLINKLV
jgi:hypothetical protein